MQFWLECHYRYKYYTKVVLRLRYSCRGRRVIKKQFVILSRVSSEIIIKLPLFDENAVLKMEIYFNFFFLLPYNCFLIYFFLLVLRCDNYFEKYEVKFDDKSIKISVKRATKSRRLIVNVTFVI